MLGWGEAEREWAKERRSERSKLSGGGEESEIGASLCQPNRDAARMERAVVEM